MDRLVIADGIDEKPLAVAGRRIVVPEGDDVGRNACLEERNGAASIEGIVIASTPGRPSTCRQAPGSTAPVRRGASVARRHRPTEIVRFAPGTGNVCT